MFSSSYVVLTFSCLVTFACAVHLVEEGPAARIEGNDVIAPVERSDDVEERAAALENELDDALLSREKRGKKCGKNGKSCDSVPVVNAYCSPIVSALPQDCYEIQAQCSSSELPSGIYEIHPVEYPTSFRVYCDFDTDKGGWTVFQRRMDGSINFKRTWADYKDGFGFLSTEFWLGNEKLAYMTAQKTYELRIELANKVGDPFYATYSSFRIGDEKNLYRIMLGEFVGNTSFDALDYHRGMAFSTRDRDNDKHKTNCAITHSGGWWFNACDKSNLNGVFGVEIDGGAIEWTDLPGGSYNLQWTSMKIRPVV